MSIYFFIRLYASPIFTYSFGCFLPQQGPNDWGQPQSTYFSRILFCLKKWRKYLKQISSEYMKMVRLTLFGEWLKEYAKCLAKNDSITLNVTAASFFHIFLIQNNQINKIPFQNNQHFKIQLLRMFSRAVLTFYKLFTFFLLLNL